MAKDIEGSETSCSPTGTGSQSASQSTGTLRKLVRAHPILAKCLYAAIFLIVVCSFLVYDSSFAKQVEYNRSDLMMLGTEMLTEAGPKFQDAAKRHASLLRKYKTDMKPGRKASLLAFLPPYRKYNPEKGIDEAIVILDTIKGNDIRENADAVWKAGEQLMKFRDTTSNFFRRIGSYTPGKMPKPLLKQIVDANAVSGKAWISFDKRTTLAKEYEILFEAWKLCEANRKTMLLIFVGRGYACDKDDAVLLARVTEQFQIIAQKAAKAKQKWAQTLKVNSPARELVELFAQSEDRRAKILQEMGNNGDMNEAHKLMWEAIENAIQMRERVLEIALELEGETRDWKQFSL